MKSEMYLCARCEYVFCKDTHHLHQECSSIRMKQRFVIVTHRHHLQGHPITIRTEWASGLFEVKNVMWKSQQQLVTSATPDISISWWIFLFNINFVHSHRNEDEWECQCLFLILCSRVRMSDVTDSFQMISILDRSLPKYLTWRTWENYDLTWDLYQIFNTTLSWYLKSFTSPVSRASSTRSSSKFSIAFVQHWFKNHGQSIIPFPNIW